MAHVLGIDLGSSSVKVSLLDTATGRTLDQEQRPAAAEMAIEAPRPHWAEQDPHRWWANTTEAIRALKARHSLAEVSAIGVAYQMHGLVLLDAEGEVVRPSIIWCDSRAVALGREAAESIGQHRIETTTLNGPGNFTASKWAWVARHEPEVLARATTVMLPGDYIAFKLTGERNTTASGLSEMILWDFGQRRPASFVLEHYGLDVDLLPPLVPTFGDQGTVLAEVAQEFGFRQNARVAYRAGDQPNNAYALNVLEPGETAATAGTSGVVYAVTDQRVYDRQQRVNAFLHVNAAAEAERLGVLLCVNGTGSAYAWLRRTLGATALPDYAQVNAWAAESEIGGDGLRFYPWGNGAERMLGNADLGARLEGLTFARHGAPELCAAVQDGIAAALTYGTRGLDDVGARPQVVRAGRANLFLSDRFAQAFAQLGEAPLQLYDTDGAQGAARGAAVGAREYADHAEALASLRVVAEFEPRAELAAAYEDYYERWLAGMQR